MVQFVFRTEGLRKTYDTGEVQVHALAGVDLELYAGELAVLLGASGSGKSTLLNILGGLDHASAGRVWFRDLELTDLGDRALTRSTSHTMTCALPINPSAPLLRQTRTFRRGSMVCDACVPR